MLGLPSEMKEIATCGIAPQEKGGIMLRELFKLTTYILSDILLLFLYQVTHKPSILSKAQSWKLL